MEEFQFVENLDEQKIDLKAVRTKNLEHLEKVLPVLIKNSADRNEDLSRWVEFQKVFNQRKKELLKREVSLEYFYGCIFSAYAGITLGKIALGSEYQPDLAYEATIFSAVFPVITVAILIQRHKIDQFFSQKKIDFDKDK